MGFEKRQMAFTTTINRAVLFQTQDFAKANKRRLLNPYKLSQMLRPFHIKPKALWSTAGGDKKRTLRGYFIVDFKEAFDRYL